MNLAQAATILRPGTHWNMRGNQLEQASGETPVSVPEKTELDQVIAAHAYKEQRRNEYPTIEDQLDALWKGGAEAQAMKDKIMAVKAKYPKP